MRRKKEHGHVNHERWLVSYADFITLLFAFFVVMFASSRSDKKKVQQVEYSIHSAFETMGVFQDMSTIPNIASVPENAAPAAGSMQDDMDLSAKQMADLNRIKLRMELLLAKEIQHHTVSINMSPDGLVISLREAGFFESGSATPIPSSMKTLYAIAHALGETSYGIRIEGNTDNIPIHNDHFDSNWELSTTRATVLAHIFITNAHINPIRMSAAGYAQFHPVASNATAEGRSRNRRVDIVVLPNNRRYPRIGKAVALSNSIAVNKPAGKLPPATFTVESTVARNTARELAPVLKALRSNPPPLSQPRD